MIMGIGITQTFLCLEIVTIYSDDNTQFLADAIKVAEKAVLSTVTSLRRPSGFRHNKNEVKTRYHLL